MHKIIVRTRIFHGIIDFPIEIVVLFIHFGLFYQPCIYIHFIGSFNNYRTSITQFPRIQSVGLYKWKHNCFVLCCFGSNFSLLLWIMEWNCGKFALRGKKKTWLTLVHQSIDTIKSKVFGHRKILKLSVQRIG